MLAARTGLISITVGQRPTVGNTLYLLPELKIGGAKGRISGTTQIKSCLSGSPLSLFVTASRWHCGYENLTFQVKIGHFADNHIFYLAKVVLFYKYGDN